MAYLGIDIGGSKIAAGLTEGNRILCEETLENKYFGCPDQMVEAIAQCVEKLETSCCKNAVGIGVGCPGWVIDGVVYEAVNLGIKEFNLQKILQQRCRTPVRVENDARTALLCEKKYGALRSSINGAMITFGTGIGGALLLNGDLYCGSFGHAGEIGHMTIGSKEYFCGCGKWGCYELFGSVRALIALARKAGIKADNGEEFFKEVTQENPVALSCLETYLDQAASGIIEVSMLLDLDTIAIGGAISVQKERFVSPLEKKVRAYCPHCRVITSAFGNHAGLIGAALLNQ